MPGADWPPRLTVEIAPALHLFTGENFYSLPDAALREAVLNAIDAIGRRQETESAIEPHIGVTFDRANQTVTVSRNGDGIDSAARADRQGGTEMHDGVLSAVGGRESGDEHSGGPCAFAGKGTTEAVDLGAGPQWQRKRGRIVTM